MLSESTCTSCASGSKLHDKSTTPSLLEGILGSKIAKYFKMLLLIQDHLHDRQSNAEDKGLWNSVFRELKLHQGREHKE